MFHWNIPFLGRPILWYGVFFALGFVIGYYTLLSQLKHVEEKKVRERPKFWADKIVFYVVLGTVIGARLGDVLFYQGWDLLLKDPWSAVKFWEGGLASHGGVVGITIAIFLFSRRYQLDWKRVLDWLALPAGIVGCCIRIGNFINQEILGTVTHVPWAVVFGHPADGRLLVPRHPVQLYEAGFYLVLFLVLWLTVRKKRLPAGRLAGMVLTAVFAFRFLIEFFKEEQSAWFAFPLHMGQLLSIPLLILGLFLLLRRN